MSRHEYPGLVANTCVAIGWDRPLATFFAQVSRVGTPIADAECEDEDLDDPVILWVGTTPAELPYAAEAIRIARAHAMLPSDIGRTLELDRLRTAGDSDGSAQQANRPFLNK